MELTEIQEKIWTQVKSDLSEEPVASTDHIERLQGWTSQGQRDLKRGGLCGRKN